jgi:hypothetical protein
VHPAQYRKVLDGEVALSEAPHAAAKQAQWEGSASIRGPPLADDALLTSAQIRARIGDVSNMCLWRWTRDPRVRFPRPDVVINNRKYWYAGTLRRWQKSQQERVA